jgi:hypothetical protein
MPFCQPEISFAPRVLSLLWGYLCLRPQRRSGAELQEGQGKKSRALSLAITLIRHDRKYL